MDSLLVRLRGSEDDGVRVLRMQPTGDLVGGKDVSALNGLEERGEGGGVARKLYIIYPPWNVPGLPSPEKRMI